MKFDIEVIFRQYYRPLVYFANQIIDDRPASEDIAMECIDKISRTTKLIENEKRLKAYLYKTVKNACLDLLRRKSFHQKSHMELRVLYAEWELMGDTEMVRTQILQEVYDHVKQMPPQLQTVFKGYYLEGKTTDELALAINISQRTVINHKTRLVAILRSRFTGRDLWTWVFVSLINTCF
jgi:RNA polymerase sigma factor (sigma-70 family)